MTTLNLQVDAGAGDAHEKEDGTDFSSIANFVSMYSGTVPSDINNGGFRFSPVAIPSGAVIDSAILQVNLISTFLDDINVDIHAEDVDDAVDFVSDADVTSRVRTAASVAWVQDSLGTGYKSSPEVKTVIQEVISRPGWAKNNGLVVLVTGNSDLDKLCDAYSYEDFALTRSAKLDIDFTPRLVGRVGSARGVMRGVRKGIG